MADLVNYKPSDYPQIPNAEAQYFTKEFRNISTAINSAEKAIVSDESDITTINSEITAIGPQFRSYLAGLQLSNDATTPNSVLDISAGVCRDSTNAATITLGAFTKSTAGTWVAGSGNNAMGAGLTIAASTWYHVFAIINAGAADVYFDTSVTAANAPASTTAHRRIGSFLTDGSAHIVAFTQNGDEFLWKQEFQNTSAVNTTTVSAATTVSTPLGVETIAKLHIGLAFVASNVTILVYPLDMGTQVCQAVQGQFSVYVPNATVSYAQAELAVRTNTSSQVGVVAQSTGCQSYLSSFGYIDRRGRDN